MVIKEWLEDETDIELNSIRLCLLIRDGYYEVMWNPSNSTTHRTDYTMLDYYNYMYQKIDIHVKYGWSYVAFNFETDTTTQKTKIWGYSATADQCKQVSSTFSLPGPLVDDNKFIWCLGSTIIHNQVTLAYEVRWGLQALVNNWALLRNTVIERWHAMDYFGFLCHDYCQICRAVDQPK